MCGHNYSELLIKDVWYTNEAISLFHYVQIALWNATQ
jgi:hypothetical protein